MPPRETLFGELLREHRAAANLTQEALAARSGLSLHAISMLERGVRRAPRRTTITLLSRALDLDPAQYDELASAGRRISAARPVPTADELRMPPTPLVERELQVAQAHAMLADPDIRLVTMTGPPGVGKTRLALEMAAMLEGEFRHGVFLIALASVADAELLASTIGQALGLRARGNPLPLAAVVRFCRDRELLMVLDNFEHLLAGAPLLVELMAQCPGVTLLVTSRAALRVRGEYKIAVPPLQLPGVDQSNASTPEVLGRVPSVALFVERASAAAPGFQLTAENAQTVAAICRTLDGLPLALELAAPWIKLLTPETLLDRLRRRLYLLVDGPRDLPPRQQTMRATLDSSRDLLGAEPRALFRRLSVFGGTAPLAAIETVCQAASELPGGVLGSLAVLVDHSLVLRQEEPDGQAGVGMLETVREYARELLEESGEAEATARAHVDYYGPTASDAGRGLVGAA